MGKGRLTAVSLFAGAGGCDIGLEEAGFRIVSASDFDSTCVATLRANASAGLPVRGDDSRSYLAATRLIEASVDELTGADLWGRSGTPDLLVGGPPCQPFSSAGSQRSVDDARGRLFEEFVRLADELRPRAVLFENVRGLVTARGPNGLPGEALNLVRDSFAAIGYATRFALLNAADYGLPQRRVRLFMLASRTGHPASFPEPTHAKVQRTAQPELFDPPAPWVSLREALADRPEPTTEEISVPSPALAEELAKLPNGSGLKSRGVAEPTRPSGHWGYKQGTFIADPDLPARTVTASSSQDWIRDRQDRLRRLTVAEVAALQGFPEAWAFEGSRARQYKQIGNAVPPPMARLLGQALMEALKRRENRTGACDPFPDYMTAAIAYTRKEDARNGSVRVRSPNYAGQG